MPKQQQQGSKSCRKMGRNKAKCQRYTAMHRRETNKVKRVLQSNGLEFAMAWATTHGVVGYLNRMVAAK